METVPIGSRNRADSEASDDECSSALHNGSSFKREFGLFNQMRDVLSWSLEPSNGKATSTPALKEVGFQSFIMWLTDWRWLWVYVFTFIGIELFCFFIYHDSFFGKLTGGTFLSLHSPQGLKTLWHVLGGSGMWILGFIQIAFRRLRTGPYAWIHRLSGQLFLFLWFIVMTPTSAYLSLMMSGGEQKHHLMLTLGSMVGLDVTMWACFYFCQAWVVAKRRSQGPESLILHGKLMRLGLVFSMIQLTQRPFQLLAHHIRNLIVNMTLDLPESWSILLFATNTAKALLDHHLVLSLTMLLPYGVCLMLMLDGPRSKMIRSLLELTPSQEVELFGSQESSRAQLYVWRSRLLVYVLLRGIVTNGWTQDPFPQLPSS